MLKRIKIMEQRARRPQNCENIWSKMILTIDSAVTHQVGHQLLSEIGSSNFGVNKPTTKGLETKLLAQTKLLVKFIINWFFCVCVRVCVYGNHSYEILSTT